MAHPMGESKPGLLRVGFDRRLKLEFRGSQISSDGGLLPYRELGEVFGLRALALPPAMAHWSMTTLREESVKIGARMVRHGRYITFQLAEVAVSGWMFGQILARTAPATSAPGTASQTCLSSKDRT